MKRCIGIVLLLALVFALSAYAETAWECAVCHRRVQASLGDTCPYCGTTRHVHTWQDATCTKPKTCTVCGATEGEAPGHQWDEGTVVQAATCQTMGIKSYTCTVCGTTRDERIPKDMGNHTGGTEIRDKLEATCTTDGYTGDTYCKSCGRLIRKGNAIPATGHQWNQGTVLSEATCQMVGAKRYMCTICGATRLEEIPEDPANHVGGTEIKGKLDATCTTDGYTGDTYCKGCGELINKGNAIPALGHNWQEATCTQPKACSRCGTTEGTALGHSWQDATYTEPKTCARCGATEGEPLEMPVKVGDVITFGRYPQTASGTDSTPIEWIVLDRDGSRALLLSKYGLDAQPYNTENVDITWEQCSLRKWLNNDFLTAAFSGEEQKAILLTDVDNSRSQGFSSFNTDGGNDTRDRIFLLSYAEANRYLGITGEDSGNKQSRVKPTAYAKNAGAWASDDDTGYWWLRSPGTFQSTAAHVSVGGGLSLNYVNSGIDSVRPALWINLETNEYDLSITDNTVAAAEVTGSEESRYNKPVEVGDVITFGRYPQTASGTDSTPIEWIVLDKDESRALLLSKYGLDAQPYNTEDIDITWEQCSLRKWLNGEFLTAAFSGEEQAKIAETTISNPDHWLFETAGGNATADRVFLLSEDEAEHYFNTDDGGMTKPTPFAAKKGACVITAEDIREDEWLEQKHEGICYWWLRSPGYDQYRAAYVVRGVDYYGTFVSYDYNVVRPAIWLNLES